MESTSGDSFDLLVLERANDTGLLSFFEVAVAALSFVVGLTATTPCVDNTMLIKGH